MRRLFVSSFVMLILSILISCSEYNQKLEIVKIFSQEIEIGQNMAYFRKLPNNRILIFNKFPQFIKILSFTNNKFFVETNFGDRGKGPNEFQHITSIFVNNNNIDIVDWGNNRIMSYKYENNQFIEFAPSSRNNILTINKFKKDLLFQTYGLETNILLYKNTEEEVILNKKSFHNDPILKLISNYIKIKTDGNFLYIFYPYIGDFIIYDNNYRFINQIKANKIFKIKEFGLKQSEGKIKRNRVFDDFCLYQNLILFYKSYETNKNEYTDIYPLDWQSKKILTKTTINSKINYLDRYKDVYLALEDERILVFDIKLIGEK